MDGTTTEQRGRRSSSLRSDSFAGDNRQLGGKHQRRQSLNILKNDEHKHCDEDGRSDGQSASPSSSDVEMDDIGSDEEIADDEETGLTRPDRRKRGRRKRRNTHLDERIVAEVKITKEEEKLATQSLLRASLINAVLIGFWYLFSISISIYNKWMFSKGDDKLDFPFPLFTTCVHMIVQFSLASLVLMAIPGFRPRNGSFSQHQDQVDTPSQTSSHSGKPLVTRWFYLTRLGPCGAATGLDIGLGNMSLKFISLTFFTMCKSSVLGFVLLFAILFRLEKPSWRLGGIIATMTVGVIMMVADETAFDTLGFILVMSAAFSSGLRWSLTQILLLRHPATSNPFSSIFFLAPIMFVSLLIIAVPVEGIPALIEGLNVLIEAKGILFAVLIILFPGVLAFLMTASEFALLKRTSVVTLSIAGIFKEVVTISAAGVVFGDELTPINISGLVITIGSIAAYNYIKFTKMRNEARRDAHLTVEQYAPVLSAEGRAEPGNERNAGRRQSTNEMIRHSLSINPIVQSGPPAAEGPSRASHIKQPQNVD